MVSGPVVILFVLIGLAILLIALFAFRPSVTTTPTRKILDFAALFILPSVCLAMGFQVHMERSKQTQFCISCHAMTPWGQSLYVDDLHHLAATHFQNHLVPHSQACFTCHTTYTIFGDAQAKLSGLKHIYMQYIAGPPKVIRISSPYNNRECLHCHSGMRVFEEGPVHAAMMDQFKSNSISCLSSGCHDVVHNTSGLAKEKLWRPGQP
ncbi:MAG: NapC/NirT family cytochrome c [Acidobacteriia bacterium]|nr:NapC/NirT family cytochrome c [Terriglobia bacterium]